MTCQGRCKKASAQCSVAQKVSRAKMPTSAYRSSLTTSCSQATVTSHKGPKQQEKQGTSHIEAPQIAASGKHPRAHRQRCACPLLPACSTALARCGQSWTWVAGSCRVLNYVNKGSDAARHTASGYRPSDQKALPTVCGSQAVTSGANRVRGSCPHMLPPTRGQLGRVAPPSHVPPYPAKWSTRRGSRPGAAQGQ